MGIWEYKHISYVADDSILNVWGEHGWEAYAVIKEHDCYTVFMKRKKYTKNKTK